MGVYETGVFMTEYYLGFDIGGTKCAVVLGMYKDGNMTIADKTSFATQTEKGWEFAVGNIFSAAEKMIAANSLSDKDFVSIGVKAYLQNDANACGVAEWQFGAAKGAENAVFLTFGTGLGAGLILDGRLYEGTNGMAGEVGHIRLSPHGPVGYGKEGSFEGFCSGGGIAQLGRTMALEAIQKGESVSFCQGIDSLDGITAKSVAEAAKNGDPVAKKVYEVCGEYLGRGLSVIIDILNPEVVVIGSIYERSSELLIESMEREIKKEALSASSSVCRIVPAVLGDSIGDYAALAVAVNK